MRVLVKVVLGADAARSELGVGVAPAPPAGTKPDPLGDRLPVGAPPAYHGNEHLRVLAGEDRAFGEHLVPQGATQPPAPAGDPIAR